MTDVVLDLALRRVAFGAADALRDVSLRVSRGEIVGVAGHVGAGKTTLALAASDLLVRATRASVDGQVRHPAGGAPPAGFVFANPWTQLTQLGGTVTEEVAVGPENLALEAGEIQRRVERALQGADAEPLASRDPRELSGGELQRVALASALALEAPLLVLDEPTAQLDPAAAARFAGRLRALARLGHGILLVEQDLELLASVATRVLILGDGRVLAEGEPRSLLEQWPPLDPRLGATARIERERVPPPIRAPAGGPLLEITALTAGYGEREVLSDLSLHLARGVAMAWFGENGAGKSTLARAIMGLVPAQRGSIRVEGIALDALPVERRARSVGLVFQDPSRQLFERTALDEALFGPRMLGLSRGEALSGAHEALRLVGLADDAHRNPADLVPQAQRRLAIAAAMASRPPLLILDEPTAGQDAAGRAWIAAALDAQCQRGAAAVITHDTEFAQRHCGQFVTLAAGKLSNIRTGSL